METESLKIINWLTPKHTAIGCDDNSLINSYIDNHVAKCSRCFLLGFWNLSDIGDGWVVPKTVIFTTADEIKRQSLIDSAKAKLTQEEKDALGL